MQLIVDGTAYTYEVLSRQVTQLIVLCSAEKQVEAVELAASLLVPQLPDNADNAFKRVLVGQAIVADVMGRLNTAKNSAVPSLPAKQ